MRLALIILVSALGAATGLVPDSAAQPGTTPNTAARPAMPAPATDTFLSKVAAATAFEVESSKLALKKAGSERVKAFANRMVNDHGVAAKTFKQAVSEARLTAPPEAMDAKHKTLVEVLQKKDAVDFEDGYVSAQYDAHVETVAMFESYAASGDNARIRQFAQELLPTLREHLDQVAKLR